ncbi:MAG: STAS domain-containing protein [Anaerolineae bacterium]|nr:STAS domain-containing protein [Anaerolineae bacterium]
MDASTTVQKLEDLLLVAVPRDLMDDEVLHLRRQIVSDIRRYHSRWVMLDFSLVDICDSFFGRFIQSTADMVGLMGADVIVSGLQDAVIETMVELGMTLPHIHAVLDLDDALALSRSHQREYTDIYNYDAFSTDGAGEDSTPFTMMGTTGVNSEDHWGWDPAGANLLTADLRGV